MSDDHDTVRAAIQEVAGEDLVLDWMISARLATADDPDANTFYVLYSADAAVRLGLAEYAATRFRKQIAEAE